MDDYPPLEDITLDRYSLLNRAWLNLNDLTTNPDTYTYLYTALDLRFFIESLFLELISTAKQGALSTRDRSTYRAKEYVALISRMGESIESTSLKAFGITISQKEAGDLVTMYGKLGSFLHLPKSPYFSDDQTGWKNHAEIFIADCYQFLESLNRRFSIPARHDQITRDLE